MFPHGGKEVRWGEVGAVDFNWFVYSLPFSRIGHCLPQHSTNIYILIQTLAVVFRFMFYGMRHHGLPDIMVQARVKMA